MKVRLLGFIFCAAARTAVLFAQGGPAVISHDGNCQVTVPSDWATSGNFGLATSPDKSMSVIVSSPNLSPTLDKVKKNAPLLYPHDKVVKDTPTEFQMEGEGINGRPNVYRAIQVPNRVCLVEVTYGESIDEARQIVQTLKSAK